MKRFNSKQEINNLDKIYFIGIGGIGVSALAFWCIEKKINVFGYDREKNDITKKLQSMGANIFYSYNVEESKKKDSQHTKILQSFTQTPRSIVVFSSAIKINHPLRIFFNDNKTLIIKRSEFLGIISREYDVIAISGTHGKTTISTMLTHILKVGGVDCTAFLGGISKNYNSNFILGTSNIMVVEADEFDKSFFHLKPKIILVSAIDKDHTDVYPTLQDMHSAYEYFILNSKPRLTHLIIKENLSLKSLGIPVTLEYSFSNNADYNLDIKKYKNGRLKLTFLEKNTKTGNLQNLGSFNSFQYPEHNLENFLAASAVAFQLGIKIKEIKKSIHSFLGIKRRFEYHINNKNHIFIEDYAHHPKEIDALIHSLRSMYNSKKVTFIFQPHLYSRTKDLLNEFAKSLSKVDTLILLDIYAARETPLEGFTILKLYELINAKEKKLVSKEQLIPVVNQLKPELLVSVGAGDITKYSGKLKEVLQ